MGKSSITVATWGISIHKAWNTHSNIWAFASSMKAWQHPNIHWKAYPMTCKVISYSFHAWHFVFSTGRRISVNAILSLAHQWQWPPCPLPSFPWSWRTPAWGSQPHQCCYPQTVVQDDVDLDEPAPQPKHTHIHTSTEQWNMINSWCYCL